MFNMKRKQKSETSILKFEDHRPILCKDPSS